MPTVADVIAVKGEQVHSITPQTTVLDAIRKMNQHKIGALLVMHDKQVAGIFTERDVLRRVIQNGRRESCLRGTGRRPQLWIDLERRL